MELKELILNSSMHCGYREELIQSAGYQIVLSIWPAAPNQPQRGSLVFSPGTGDHPLLYQVYNQGLAKAGYNVVGIHFAGTGKSPRTDTKYRWQTFKENIQDAVTYTRKHFAGPVGLLGSSQGGLLTYQMMAELEYIDLAICHNIGVPANQDSVELTKFPNRIRAIPYIHYALFGIPSALMPNAKMPLSVYLKEQRLFTKSDINHMNKTDPIKNRYLPYRFFWTLLQSKPAIDLADYKTPLLVLAGQNDAIFPLNYIQRYFEQTGSPDKTLHIFKNAGHMFMVEEPEKSLRVTLDWLNQRRPVQRSAARL